MVSRKKGSTLGLIGQSVRCPQECMCGLVRHGV
jgi:hypothetical protein